MFDSLIILSIMHLISCYSLHAYLYDRWQRFAVYSMIYDLEMITSDREYIIFFLPFLNKYSYQHAILSVIKDAIYTYTLSKSRI